MRTFWWVHRVPRTLTLPCSRVYLVAVARVVRDSTPYVLRRGCAGGVGWARLAAMEECE